MSALQSIRTERAAIEAANAAIDQAIIAARAEGATWDEIVEASGITERKMMALRNRLRIPDQPAPRRGSTKGACRTPGTYAAVETLRKEGRTFEEIGDELGIATQHAWIIAKKLGLTAPRHRAGQEQRA